MADKLYSTLITDIGAEKIAAALAAGESYLIVNTAVGDGDGAYYVPTPAQTTLRNEVWRGEIAACEVDPSSPNMLNVRFVLPPDVGGWTVREAGLFDSDGAMLAVCNLPDTMKAIYSSGTTGKLTIVMHIVVTDAGVLEFKITPELDTVSQDQLAAAIAAHDDSSTSHSDIRAQINQTIQSTVENYYTKTETDENISSAVYNHDSNIDAHGDVRADVAQLESRVTAIEVIVNGGISTNPFNVIFETLDGMTVTGVWNQIQERIEF